MLELNSAFKMRLEINLDQIARLSDPTVLMQYLIIDQRVI